MERLLADPHRHTEREDAASPARCVASALPAPVSSRSMSFSFMHLTHLSCTLCGKTHDAHVAQNVSTCCSKPLFAHYDLAAAARTMTKEALRTRGKSLWRYR